MQNTISQRIFNIEKYQRFSITAGTKQINIVMAESKIISFVFFVVFLFKKSGITREAEMFMKKWGSKVQVVQSQDTWVDFTAPMVTKGAALYMVQQAFGFNYDETMTFGDNYNDLDMFAQSFFSYAIQDAAPDIRNSARFLAPDVETILMDILII